jgi:hypothetical protein
MGYDRSIIPIGHPGTKLGIFATLWSIYRRLIYPLTPELDWATMIVPIIPIIANNLSTIEAEGRGNLPGCKYTKAFGIIKGDWDDDDNVDNPNNPE